MEAEAAASSSAGATASSSKKALPSLPFRLKMRYGEGALRVDPHAPESTEASMAAAAAAAHHSSASAASAAAAASPYLVHDGCASTVDLPCISFSASPLQLHIRLLLFPAHKRAEVGRFLSSMHALQRSCHFIFGWDCWQTRGRITDEHASSTDSSAASSASTPAAGAASTDDSDCVLTIGGVSYPVLHLRLWSNPFLAANRLQVVEAQRVLLAGLAPGLSRAFGPRDMQHLLRAVLQSVYRAHGLPTQQHVRPPLPAPPTSNNNNAAASTSAAASASSGADGATAAVTVAPRPAEQFDIRFDDPLAQLLALVQHHLSAVHAQQRANGSSSYAAAVPLSRPPPGFPALPLSFSAAPTALPAAASVAASSAASGLCSLLPLDLALPLWSGLSRPLQSSLALLGKSVAFVHAIDAQIHEEEEEASSAAASAPSAAGAGTSALGALSATSVDPPTQTRHVRLAMQGCDWPSVHTFLQERLPSHNSGGSSESEGEPSNSHPSTASNASTLLHQRFAELARAVSSFCAWLGWFSPPAQKVGAEKKQ